MSQFQRNGHRPSTAPLLPADGQERPSLVTAFEAEAVERELIGLLIEDASVSGVLEAHLLELCADLHLAPGHLGGYQTRRIYAAMLALARAGRRPSLLLLYEHLRHSEGDDFSVRDLQLRSEQDFLGVDATREQVRAYVAIVQEAARRRELVSIAQTTATLVSDPHLTDAAEEAMTRMQRRLDALRAEHRPLASGHVSEATDRFRQDLAEWRASPYALRGTTTGIKCLDDLVHGIRRGHLWVIGARPSMGKSALLLSMILAGARACQPGHQVGLISLEMTKEALIHRLVAQMSGQDADAIERGAHWVDWERVEAAVDEVEALPLRIADQNDATVRVNGSGGAMTPDAIRTVVAAWHQEGALDLVGVDYLELVAPPEDMSRENYDLRLSAIAWRLKQLAAELVIPVVLLAQLNREVAKGATKIPTLEGLRYSDGPAMHANVVLFPVRWAYYRERGQEEALPEDVKDLPAGVTDLMVAKNRQGRVGKLRAYCDAATQRFLDWNEERGCAQDYHGREVPLSDGPRPRRAWNEARSEARSETRREGGVRDE